MIDGNIDASLDLFGGLVNDMAPADLPDGVSPDCADVQFEVGAVRTRPGLVSLLALGGSNPTVNYIKTVEFPNLTEYLLYLDSSGDLWANDGTGTQINGGGSPSFIPPNTRAHSATLFGREYMAFHDGKFGIDIPRQWDGTHLDRVSNSGPGNAPTVAEVANTSYAIASSGTPIQRANNQVTLVLSGILTSVFPAGSQIVIAGVADSTYDGTFTVAGSAWNHLTGSNARTYIGWSQSGADSTSNSGTATPGGITAGLHQVAVAFVLRSGAITQPSPGASWTASGTGSVQVSNIPVPALYTDVVARLLMFTAANGSAFYYSTGSNGTPNMLVPGTSAATVTLSFIDSQLLSSTPAASLFDQIELGYCAGMIGYSDRLVCWGERNRVPNFLNMDFSGDASTSLPGGWTQDPVNGAGGVMVRNPAWGMSYEIVSDGNSAHLGMITQSAYQDQFGVPILQPNTSYSVRVRAHLDVNQYATAGNLVVDLYSPTSGQLGVFTIAATAMNTELLEFVGVLTAGIASSVPSDVLLRLYRDANLPAAEALVCDGIEIYPTTTPYNQTDARLSAPDDPESFDPVNGLVQLRSNSQAIRAAFVLTDRSELVASDHLYLVKEKSLYHTQDNGGSPSTWDVTEVSSTVGTLSVEGAAVGEDWAVIASPAGLYLFWFGSEPQKISQEIQPLWDSINWAAGDTLWVRVDTVNKRIMVGAPIGAATTPNRILVLDYRGLVSASDILSTPPVHFSSYSGKMIALGLGRKWAPWFISANSCWFEPPGSPLQIPSPSAGAVFLGNGAGNGKLYYLSDQAINGGTVGDDGAAINSYYTSYLCPTQQQEAQYQLRSHRKLFSYLTMYIEGAGTPAITAYPESLANPNVVQIPAPGAPAVTLSGTGLEDLELPINITAERVAFRISTDAAGSWFRLQKFIPSLANSPWSPLRGIN